MELYSFEGYNLNSLNIRGKIMLFTSDLEEKIFNRHQFIDCDELIIISGYVGPRPIQRLQSLPFKTTVVYGMYGSDSISQQLHQTLIKFHTPGQHEVLYSNIPVHSKIYVWKNQSDIVYALIGSANFSKNGLTIPLRESLAETTRDTFTDLDNYISQILQNAVECSAETISTIQVRTSLTTNPVTSAPCSIVLYDPVTGEVPPRSGLNWGHSLGHTNLGDSYITIRTSHIQSYPHLFPPKQMRSTRVGGRSHRQNDAIELVWDDGILMDALLEGSQKINGRFFPKQLSSHPSKNVLGRYIRERLGLSPQALVTRADLDNYGRSDISITRLQDGTYFVDFSV